MTDALGIAMAVIAVFGLGTVVVGLAAVRRFARELPRSRAHARPAVSVLKPLCGDEPMLAEALASICRQTYPAFQIVFGVQSARDPALRAVAQVRARFPGHDIAVVVDPTPHGPNRKIANLINMLPAAKHDVLVFSDSDLHVPPDYLDRIVDGLAVPGTGLVTSLCMGLPTSPGPVARLGASGISHSFLPGALLARGLGRQDCLGTTMALRRATLARVGGLASLVGHLADDHVLADRVRAVGLRVGLARTVPMTAVPERSWRALWQHELRWARTIRALEPALFATSAAQYPLFWALAGVLAAGGAPWSLALFALAWAARAAAARLADRALLGDRAMRAAPVGLLPLRDLMSVAILIASYFGGGVVWRGHRLWADDGRAHDGRDVGRVSSARYGNRPATGQGSGSKPASAQAAG